MQTTYGRRIWKLTKPWNSSSTDPVPGRIRWEFPHLVRFKGAWYCVFRESPIHMNHESLARIIRSADGVTWEEAAVLGWDCGDMGMPRFSITPEGNLMLNTTVFFVSKEPRADGDRYQLDKPPEGWSNWTPASDRERDVACQTLTWFTVDGRRWDGPYACPASANTQRCDVAWHNGMGYGVGYGGKDVAGALYRSRDGKNWRVLKARFFPDPPQDCNEVDMAFEPDDTAVCLVRAGTGTYAWIGRGKPPYYQEWEWRVPAVDWDGDGRTRPIREVLRAHMGGPDIIRLRDGRLVAAARMLGPAHPGGTVPPDRVDPDDPEGREDGRVTLFLVDSKNSVLTMFGEVDGTSYPGIVEHEGMIWTSYIGADRSGVFLAKVKVPG